MLAPFIQVYECNDAPDSAWSGKATDALFSNDARFDFYSERYMNETANVEFARDQVKQAHVLVAELQARDVDAATAAFVLE